MNIPYVTITKYFPEMQGRSFEELRDFIEQDPREMLQGADIEITTEEGSESTFTASKAKSHSREPKR